MRLLFPILLPLIFLATTAFTVQPTSLQPKDERKVQSGLPQSKDEIWVVFAKCKVHLDKKNFVYTMDFTDEVKAMVDKPLTVSGFMLPLESKEKFTHYLLSKRTPTCPFCPPGEPNEIVEVFSKKPVSWDEGIVVVTGTMKLAEKSENGMFFQLKDAESMDIAPAEKKSKMPNL